MKFHSPIVLLTDFGTKDSYAASMKGVILTYDPEAVIMDLTHEISPQNITQAAFVLEWTYSFCPKNSIFISVVDPGVGSKRRILAAKTRRGIFLAPDNGLLTRVLEKEKSYELRFVTNKNFFARTVSYTFHGRDCFAPAGARLAKDPSLFSQLGPRANHFVRLDLGESQMRAGKLKGEILFFDHFGNAFINIPKTLLARHPKRSGHRVKARGKNLGPIRQSYYEVKKGQLVVVFNSMGLLEIAINQGNAREKLKLKEGDSVEVG